MLKKYLLPKTKLGRTSVYLSLAFWLFFAVFSFFVKSGYGGGDTFFSNPALAVPISLAGLCGIASFVVGLYSFFKKEKSLVVILVTLWGGFVLLFALGEIITPH